MLKVYVKLDEVWNYFQCKKEHFKDAMDSIAEVLDNETERPLVRIYLTEENGYPLMTVEQVCENDGEEVIEKECAISLNDCTSVYRKMLTMLEEYDTDLEQVSAADEIEFWKKLKLQFYIVLLTPRSQVRVLLRACYAEIAQLVEQ